MTTKRSRIPYIRVKPIIERDSEFFARRLGTPNIPKSLDAPHRGERNGMMCWG
jgi:hypothetical protein